MKISQITDFLESAYSILNNHFFNGELQPVVITIQSSPKTFGHYTKYDAWQEQETGYREINISAETLNRPIENTISTLIHEMVHHYCDQNGIKDCSRGGTYHNRKFKEQAEQRGLLIDYDPKIGYSVTSPTPELITFIESQGWTDVDLSRQTPAAVKGRRPSSTRKYICECCGCSVRASKVVNIGCLTCGTVMVLEEN